MGNVYVPGFSTTVVFEKKIRPHLSYYLENKLTTAILKTTPFSESYVYTNTFGVGGKNYFNMNKRIRNGKSANNFSGEYYAFQAMYSIASVRKED